MQRDEASLQELMKAIKRLRLACGRYARSSESEKEKRLHSIKSHEANVMKSAFNFIQAVRQKYSPLVNGKQITNWEAVGQIGDLNIQLVSISEEGEHKRLLVAGHLPLHEAQTD